MNLSIEENYIDLSDVAELLNRRAFNNNQRQIIEEVAFLCVNKNFIKGVIKIRKQIQKKYSQLPPLPLDSRRRAERVLGFVYANYYEPYKKAVTDLIEKYKLLPHLYWNDKFFHLDSDIRHEIESASRSYEGKISKMEARYRAIENIREDIDLDMIDSLILRNKPFDIRDGFPFWCNAAWTRETSRVIGIGVNINKEGITQLEIGFPPYATLPEMQKLLKDNYGKIQKKRAESLPVPAQRDHRKDNLAKMIDAYMLDVSGKEKTTIANYLDSKYKSNHSFEAVTQLIKRMETEAKRFDRAKQET